MLDLDFSLEHPLFVVFALFVLIWLIQQFYYWVIFGRLAFYKRNNNSTSCKPLSVVICAKNEYLNLKKFLPSVLEQDYPNYEVVVVNDSSEDDSEYLLNDYKAKYAHLTVVNLKKNVNFFEGKKFPLALGIRSAKHDILVMTDADCYPKSNKWLLNIQSHYQNDENRIVLGYSPYQKTNGFVNTLIRFDTFYIAVQYLSYALFKIPYMGVGRNLSYHRSLFIKNKGFSSHYQIISGDDDIFISQVANSKNVSIEVSEDAHIVSLPKRTFIEWVNQKRRHFTTYNFYKTKHKFFLGLFSFSNIFYYALFILLMVLKYNILAVLSLFFLRLITQLIIYKKTINKLSERKLLLFSPIFEFLIAVINPLIALSNLLSKKKKWN